MRLCLIFETVSEHVLGEDHHVTAEGKEDELHSLETAAALEEAEGKDSAIAALESDEAFVVAGLLDDEPASEVPRPAQQTNELSLDMEEAALNGKAEDLGASHDHVLALVLGMEMCPDRCGRHRQT